MKTCILIFPLLSLFFAACTDKKSREDVYVPHYEIELGLDPSQHNLAVNGYMSMPVVKDTLRELTFLLHKDLNVEELKGDNIRTYSIDRTSPTDIAWIPDAVWVNVELDQPVGPGQVIELFYSYSGNINHVNPYLANAITKDWVELGLYLPWYLYSADITDFTYRVDLTSPDSYRISGLHEVDRKENSWELFSNIPVNDIVIIASRDLKSQSGDSGDIKVVFDYVTLSDTTVSRMTNDIQSIVNWLSQQFGCVPVQTVHVVQSKREKGGGYARMGGVVLGDLNEQDYVSLHKAYQRYFAHELAHLWWRHASTTSWHDWINEGFAEFSAFMYLRDRFGDEYYKKSIEIKRGRIADTPPLWEFDRHDQTNPEYARIVQINLYDKGPVLLSDLEQQIGYQRFITFCERLLSHRTIDTDQLLSSLSSVTSEEVSDNFMTALKTF